MASEKPENTSGEVPEVDGRDDVSPWRQLDDPAYKQTFEYTNAAGHHLYRVKCLIFFMRQVTCHGV